MGCTVASADRSGKPGIVGPVCLTLSAPAPTIGKHPWGGDSNRRFGREFRGSDLVRKFCLTVVLASSCSLAHAQTKPLPPGPMQAKIKAACTQCHNAARITEQHRTRKEWSDQLDKMVGLGAEVPDSERAAFLDYLTKNFGSQKSAAKGPAKKTSEQAK